MLGVREVMLIVRIKDEASRVLSTLSSRMGTLSKAQQDSIKKNLAMGSGLLTLGAGITAIGGAGVAFFANATMAAIEYNQQAALALTQVDNTNISLNDLKQLGKDVAAVIPVPFEEVQSALYDIFSSIDTDLAGARVLLTSFSQASVAGQVSLQDASRATIGILNAYHLKATDVNMVNDVMFQLVRKGVGTYGQFATTIGRAVPSAVRAGQSIQTLAGMMAFLTRNGLSAAMASSSAARALDALSNPKAVTNMEKLGIKVKGLHGEFRPLTDIIGQLHDKLGKLTGPQRAAAIQAIFKGAGGTIQARRFLDVAIKNPSGFNEMTGFMNKSGGQMGKAYGIMFQQPATQIQLFKNNVAILKTELGDALLPVLNELAKPLIAIFHWFAGLSDNTKKWVAWIGAGASVLAVLVGIIMMAAGAFIILSSALEILAAIFGVTAGALLLAVGWILLIIAAVIALAVVIWKYHTQIWNFLKVLWTKVKTFVMRIWNDIYDFMSFVLGAIWSYLSDTWNKIFDFTMQTFNNIWTFIQRIWNSSIMQFFIAIFALIFAVFFANLRMIWNIVSTVFLQIYHGIVDVMSNILGWLKTAAKFVFDHVIKPWWDAQVWLFNHLGTWLKWIKDHVIDPIIGTLQTVWGKVSDLFIQPIIDAWNGITDYVSRIYHTFTDLLDKIRSPIDSITNMFKKLNPFSRNSPPLTDQTRWGWQAMHKIILGNLDAIHSGVKKRTTAIRGTMDDAFGSGFGAVSLGGFNTPDFNALQAQGPNIIKKQNAIQITTQEIDPLVHAAQLGWELDRRAS